MVVGTPADTGFGEYNVGAIPTRGGSYHLETEMDPRNTLASLPTPNCYQPPLDVSTPGCCVNSQVSGLFVW